jgi:predicted phosphodiesterase
MTDAINVVEVFIPVHPQIHSNFTDTELKNFLLKNIKGEIQAAQHGTEISGRPGTLIIMTDDYVIKLRSELEIDAMDCNDFLLKTIANETKLGIYHPDKIWFYLLLNNNRTLIGNITPRLVSLDNLDSTHEEMLYQQICKSFSLYFKCITNNSIRLDLSLSNFAIKPHHPELYYLDDETYSWDDFNQLSDFLSLLIRSNKISDENIIKNLGRFLYTQLETWYPGQNYNIQIIRSLKNSFFAREKHYALLALTQSLYDTRAVLLNANDSHRMAVIADIHANAPALIKVLEFIKENGIDNILVLGDIVGYGPHPNECVEILQQQNGLQIICGNHDHAAYINHIEKTSGITSHAGWVLNWTRNTINADSIEWLAQLPMYIQDANWLAVHGAPIDEHYFNAYVYQMSYSSNLDALTQRNIPICFHGHTHIQKVYYRIKGEDFESNNNILSIKNHQHSLICPGSVGQPRCGIPGAELALFDFSDYTVHFHRLKYDINKTLSDMKKEGFPSVLVERLEQGY